MSHPLLCKRDLALCGLLVLLAACRGTRPDRPAAPGRTGAVAGGAESYESEVRLLRQIGPRLSPGSGAVARWRGRGEGGDLVLRYVDGTAPARKDVGWIIIAQARAQGRVVATLAFLLPELRPGRYRGSPADRQVAIGAAVGTDRWEAAGSETNWSFNDQGWCELELRPAADGMGLEGAFRGKLVANSDRTFVLVEDGFLYIARPPEEEACAPGDGPCLFRAGARCFKQTQDYRCALQNFSHACEEGLGPACAIAGMLHEEGLGPVRRDPFQALLFYIKACRTKDQDRDAALRTFKLVQGACPAGVPGTCGLLGVIQYTGQYCGEDFSRERDPAEGLRNICRECQRGDARSCEFAGEAGHRCE